MTTAAQARELRDRIYELHIKGLSNREIARLVGINASNVSRHLARKRHENAVWYEENRSPKDRQRTYFKEVADELVLVTKEAWREYSVAAQKGDLKGLAARVGLLKTLLAAVALYREHIGLVSPSIDELWVHDAIEEFKQAVREKRPAIIPDRD